MLLQAMITTAVPRIISSTVTVLILDLLFVIADAISIPVRMKRLVDRNPSRAETYLAKARQVLTLQDQLLGRAVGLEM